MIDGGEYLASAVLGVISALMILVLLGFPL